MTSSCVTCGKGIDPIDECKCKDRCSECRSAGYMDEHLIHMTTCSRYIPWEDLGETVYDSNDVKITEAYYVYDSSYKVYINGKLVWENGHIE